jgi:transcriptional regulator with XRE-family HTH domain
MTELGYTVEDLAAKAGLDPTTVRRAIAGRTWPRERTRYRLAEALGVQVGEIGRRALDPSPLSRFTLSELARELCNRLDNDQSGQ